jgi:3-phosphoshikimate 1-carboxyvinyltransferase
VKETDRIAAMAIELQKVGAVVEEGADYLCVTPPARLRPAAIDTYDDHRMAMCFSLVTLGDCRVRINDPKCVNKTFPGYFDEFGQIVEPVPVLAIDGPSASGKGTVAARVAAALGWNYLDSGSLYRLVALAALRGGVGFDDEAALEPVARALPVRYEGGRILLDGDDVSDRIREEDCSIGASRVAVLPAVRAALLDRQRDFRHAPGLVAEGRDIGSVVFPDAASKFFLTASAAARAQRRYKQLIEKGSAAILHDLQNDLEERDARDAARSVAPLRQLPDAVLVDTTDMGIDEAVSFVLENMRGTASRKAD